TNRAVLNGELFCRRKDHVERAVQVSIERIFLGDGIGGRVNPEHGVAGISRHVNFAVVRVESALVGVRCGVGQRKRSDVSKGHTELHYGLAYAHAIEYAAGRKQAEAVRVFWRATNVSAGGS